MNMERLWNGSDRGDTRRRTTLFIICRPYVESDNAKGYSRVVYVGTDDSQTKVLQEYI